MCPSSDTGFPDGFDPTSSILFLGSGFSTEATNVSGSSPAAGKALEQKLLKLLGLPATSDSNLKDLATHASKNGIDMYHFLLNEYTIKSITNDQSIILSKKWRRIYTTNYDDSAELYYKIAKDSPSPPSYSFEDQVPARTPPGLIVRLHGSIHRCTKDNVLNQLVLTHYSYAEQIAKNSTWWLQFERDLRSAEQIFFVGYSPKRFPCRIIPHEERDIYSEISFHIGPPN